MYKFTTSQNENLKNNKKQKEIKLLTNYIPIKKMNNNNQYFFYKKNIKKKQFITKFIWRKKCINILHLKMII